MNIKIGCDIVKISRFKDLVENNKSETLSTLFSNHELTNAKSPESLAGIFAAKESVIKALGFKPGNWHLIEIIKQENGKPTIQLHHEPDMFIISQIMSHDVSISHDGEYVFATSCFIIK